MTLQRRDFLRFSAAALALSGARPETGVKGVVRIGYLANLTHAPVLTAIAKLALPGVKIETRTFRAGPRVLRGLAGTRSTSASRGRGP